MRAAPLFSTQQHQGTSWGPPKVTTEVRDPTPQVNKPEGCLLLLSLIFTPSLSREGVEAAQEVCVTEPHFRLQEITPVEHVTAQVQDTNSHTWGFWGAAAFITKK